MARLGGAAVVNDRRIRVTNRGSAGDGVQFRDETEQVPDFGDGRRQFIGVVVTSFAEPRPSALGEGGRRAAITSADEDEPERIFTGLSRRSPFA
jgi:hypothetical protein